MLSTADDRVPLIGPRDFTLTTSRVVAVSRASRCMKRIRLESAALRGVPYHPGQHVRVRVNPFLSFLSLRSGLRDALRTYSVWRCEPDVGALELCVRDEPHGPGGTWAAGVREGDDVSFLGPMGHLVLERSAPYHLFAGDETGAVAIQAMLRALPPGAPALVALEADGPEDEFEPGDLRVPMHWTHRRGRRPGPDSGLVEHVRRLRLPAEPGLAYVAGEMTTCRALREHLVRERGWPRGAVRMKPFWAHGKRGLD